MWKFIIILSIAFSATLGAEIKVLAFSGSTREDSLNKKLICEAAALAGQMGGRVTVIDFKDYPMPFYDADLEKREGMPPGAHAFQQLMIQSDLIMIASPEYNGSVSGVLKNAIDWASRDGKGRPLRDAFKEKRFILMSASPGPAGGGRGLVHLRAILENIGAHVLARQLVVPDAYTAFDEQGLLKNEKLKNEMRQLIYTGMNQ